MKKEPTYDRYGNYILNRGQSLGSGTFGNVWKGYRIVSQNSFGSYQRLRLEPVAIKQSYFQASNVQQINILKILNHPNIIKYIDYKIYGNSLLMVMQLCEQGTLQDLLMNMPQDENQHDLLYIYYAQIVNGIKFMYEKNVLHRDIKPSNILIKDNTVKIADFGTSRFNEQKQLRTLVGTPLFSSPELLQISLPSQDTNQQLKSSYTQKSDIWSLGLVLYLMFNYQRTSDSQNQRLKKSLPWSGKHAGEVLRNILNKPLQMKKPNVPLRIQAILQKMLKIQVQQRMDFKQFLSLGDFQPQIMHQIKFNLSQSNLAVSKSFLSNNSILDDNDHCLTRVKDEQAYVAEEIEKKQIDWELLKLLQIKDSQHYEDDQIKEVIQLYNMIRTQLLQFGHNQHDANLIFLIHKKLYQLHSWRLWSIDYFKKKSMNESLTKMDTNHQTRNTEQQNKQSQNHQSHGTLNQIQRQSLIQILSEIKSSYKDSNVLIQQLQGQINQKVFQSILQKPQTQNLLVSKQKLLINYMKPSQALIKSLKQYIKRNLTQQLLGAFPSNKLKFNMDLTKEYLQKRGRIILIYDMFICLEFQFSWKIKNKLNNSYGKSYNTGYSKNSFVQTYNHIKNTVHIRQIVNRVKQAYDFLKIMSVQDQ